MTVRTPACTHAGLGSFHFARRYFGNRCFFLFLSLLRCFSSGGSLYIPMYSVCSDRGLLCRVSPFRNPRVNGYLLLTVAYRSLSRLSSALSAKASTLRPSLLYLKSKSNDRFKSDSHHSNPLRESEIWVVNISAYNLLLNTLNTCVFMDIRCLVNI